MVEDRIWIVTGEIGTGKSTFCKLAVEQARQTGLHTAGLLSPAVFEDGTKVGIRVVDAARGVSRRLAWLRSAEARTLETKRWSFDPEAVEWGNQVLVEAAPTDLLIIDELGPLEFDRGKGWVEGFRVLDEGNYRAALVVVRPSLVEQARSRWPDAEVIRLAEGDDLERKSRMAVDRILSN